MHRSCVEPEANPPDQLDRDRLNVILDCISSPCAIGKICDIDIDVAATAYDREDTVSRAIFTMNVPWVCP